MMMNKVQAYICVDLDSVKVLKGEIDYCDDILRSVLY